MYIRTLQASKPPTFPRLIFARIPDIKLYWKDPRLFRAWAGIGIGHSVLWAGLALFLASDYDKSLEKYKKWKETRTVNNDVDFSDPRVQISVASYLSACGLAWVASVYFKSKRTLSSLSVINYGKTLKLTDSSILGHKETLVPLSHVELRDTMYTKMGLNYCQYVAPDNAGFLTRRRLMSCNANIRLINTSNRATFLLDRNGIFPNPFALQKLLEGSTQLLQIQN
jgi:TMEM70/TMEM186/TMEM223 protein family